MLGFVTGCFATNVVQQSSYGRIDVSYVPIFNEISTISCLSKALDFLCYTVLYDKAFLLWKYCLPLFRFYIQESGYSPYYCWWYLSSCSGSACLTPDYKIPDTSDFIPFPFFVSIKWRSLRKAIVWIWDALGWLTPMTRPTCSIFNPSI